MIPIQIRLFGEFRVIVGRRTVVVGGGRERRALDLVKVLALAPGHRLHREQVIDALWPHLAPTAAFANLHRAASQARSIMGSKESVVLRAGDVHLWPPGTALVIDVEQFESDAAEALADGDRERCLSVAAAYGPGLLPADLYAEWTTIPREQLRRRYLELLRRAGRWAEVTQHDPGDEEANRELVRGMVAGGHRPAALRACQGLRAALSELGLQPSPETITLWRELSLLPMGVDAVELEREPMLGREQELNAARAALDGARRSRISALLVSGGVGMGKTRFCESLLAEAAQDGWTTLQGTANRAEGSAAWAPITEALDRLLVQRPDLAEALTPPAREGLDRMYGRSAPPSPGARPALPSRQPILSAVMQLLSGAARERGVVLYVDDVHEADEATLQLLHFVSRAARSERVLVVLAHRPERLSEAAARVRASLLAGHGAREIELGPLSRSDSGRLVSRAAGRPVMGAVLDTILRLAEGNPFFAEELAAAINREGTLTISRRLYETVEARVGSLPRALTTALQSVAVTGAHFTADDLAMLARLDEPALSGVLDDAVQAGLITESAEGYRFRHTLFRDALVALLPPHRRRAAHRQAADTLAARAAAPGRIAHHLLAAGAGIEAVPWLERAARAAAAAGAVAGARDLVDRALVHAPQRAPLLELRADCLFAAGEPTCLAAYSEAIAAARGHHRRLLQIRQTRAAVVLGDGVAAGRALDGVVPKGATESVRLLVARGYVALSQANLTVAASAADEARRIALEQGLVADLPEAATLRALVAHSQGTWPHQIESDLLDTRRAPQLAASIHDGHLCVVEHYLYGDQPYDKLIEFAAALRETARRNGADRGEAFATLVLGEAELLVGRIDDAEAHLLEAVALHRRIASSAGEALALQRLAEATLAQGRTDDAPPLLDRALDLARESALLVRHLLPRIYGTLIRAAVRPDAAMAVIEEAESATVEAREACRTCAITFAVPAAFACVRAGHIERARHYLAIAEDTAPPPSRAGAWNGAIAELEATLAKAEGDMEEAMKRLRAAADLFDTAGQTRDAHRCRTAECRPSPR